VLLSSCYWFQIPLIFWMLTPIYCMILSNVIRGRGLLLMLSWLQDFACVWIELKKNNCCRCAKSCASNSSWKLLELEYNDTAFSCVWFSYFMKLSFIYCNI
jgi:hypothetical protein